MQRSRSVVGAVSLCLFAVLVSAGCAKKVPITTTSVEPPSGATSASVTPTEVVVLPVDGSGPITTPEAGSELRTALMDAAREKLATNSQFVVYQLYVQGDYALGDLETAPGGTRQFVAFKGPQWQAVWVAPFGDAGATASSAKSAVPGFSEELLGRIAWKYKKPASNAAMVSSLSTAAKKWTKAQMEGEGEPYAVTLVKVAKDSKGAWWGRVIVQPASSASNSYESIEFWCKYSGGTWAGKAQDPDPPSPSTYFPSKVIGSLAF